MEPNQTTKKTGTAPARSTEWIVWVMVAVLLAGGMAFKTAMTGQYTTVQNDGLSLDIPSGWQPASRGPNETATRYVAPSSTSFYHTNVEVLTTPKSGFSKKLTTIYDISMEWGRRKSELELAFRYLDVEELTVAGKNTIRMNFSFVAEPPVDSPASLPVVVEGVAYLIDSDADIRVITFACDSQAFSSNEAIFNRSIASLKLE